MSEDVTVAATVANLEAVSGTSEQIIGPTATQNFNPPTETETSTSTVTVDATTISSPRFLNDAIDKFVENKVKEVVQAVETEAVQVEQAVVAEVEKVVAFVETEAKEGFVAGEHLVRQAINVVIGSSHIKNPA